MYIEAYTDRTVGRVLEGIGEGRHVGVRPKIHGADLTWYGNSGYSYDSPICGVDWLAGEAAALVGTLTGCEQAIHEGRPVVRHNGECGVWVPGDGCANAWLEDFDFSPISGPWWTPICENQDTALKVSYGVLFGALAVASAGSASAATGWAAVAYQAAAGCTASGGVSVVVSGLNAGEAAKACAIGAVGTGAAGAARVLGAKIGGQAVAGCLGAGAIASLTTKDMLTRVAACVGGGGSAAVSGAVADGILTRGSGVLAECIIGAGSHARRSSPESAIAGCLYSAVKRGGATTT